MSRLSRIYPTDRVTLREVGLRDGLQLVKQFPSTAAKLDWLAREHAAGVRHFELGSFLPASRFPQFADLQELLCRFLSHFIRIINDADSGLQQTLGIVM